MLLMPPTSEATHGKACCIASNKTRGKHSFKVGRMKKSDFCTDLLSLHHISFQDKLLCLQISHFHFFLKTLRINLIGFCSNEITGKFNFLSSSIFKESRSTRTPLAINRFDKKRILGVVFSLVISFASTALPGIPFHKSAPVRVSRISSHPHIRHQPTG